MWSKELSNPKSSNSTLEKAWPLGANWALPMHWKWCRRQRRCSVSLWQKVHFWVCGYACLIVHFTLPMSSTPAQLHHVLRSSHSKHYHNCLLMVSHLRFIHWHYVIPLSLMHKSYFVPEIHVFSKIDLFLMGTIIACFGQHNVAWSSLYLITTQCYLVYGLQVCRKFVVWKHDM